jgi:hypothetical protein
MYCTIVICAQIVLKVLRTLELQIVNKCIAVHSQFTPLADDRAAARLGGISSSRNFRNSTRVFVSIASSNPK